MQKEYVPVYYNVIGYYSIVLYFVNGHIINNDNFIFNILITCSFGGEYHRMRCAQLCLRQYAAHRHTCCTFAQRARIPVQLERDKYYNIYIQIREGM